jgi:hypothetical protein
MKKHYILGCTALLALNLLLSGPALAGPGLISYQGKLTDNIGTALTMPQDMRFSLYDNAVGGTLLWSETQNGVSVTDGVYDVRLGLVAPLDESQFEGNIVYLQVEIYNGSDWEALSPRQQLTSTAFAFRADTADSSINAGDADTLDGFDSLDFLSLTSDFGRSGVSATLYEGASSLTSLYVNEGQANSITSAMIADSTITAADLAVDSVAASEIATGAVGTGEILDGSVTSADLQDGAALTEIADDDGPGSGLNADFVDGLDSTAFLVTTSDFGRSGVSATLYEGASSLTSLYVNEGQAGSITSAMIVDSTITAADLAADSVGASEIAANSVGVSEINFSLDYTGSDANGGLVAMINTAAGSAGNYPAALYGGTNGSAGSYKVLGVLGTAPALGTANAALTMLPNAPIGVAGATQDGYGLVGTSTSHYHAGVYAESTKGIGVYGKHTDPSYTSPGVYGKNEGSGIGVLGEASTSTSAGVKGSSTSTSTDAKGVEGLASNSGAVTNYGGYFEAAGSAGCGVEGYATSTADSTNYGGRFQADGTYGYGVYAYSPDYYGVYAYGGSRGVYGYTSGSTSEYAIGVYGYAHSAADYGYGGYFYSGGVSGYGGYFNASGTSGTGIYATGGTSGKAAIFRGNVQIQRESDGVVVMELGAGLDYAEGFDVADNDGVEPGSVLVIDPENPGKLALSSKSYDTRVAGIVAGANNLGSGVRLGTGEFDHDVALAGRVYCNVDATRKGVEPGDLLTTSATPGYAMKVTDHGRSQGAIIGKAMEKLEKGEKGQILVLVTLQ